MALLKLVKHQHCEARNKATRQQPAESGIAAKKGRAAPTKRIERREKKEEEGEEEGET